MSVYREKILMAYKYLLEVLEELNTRTINVGMTSEIADSNSRFRIQNFEF